MEVIEKEKGFDYLLNKNVNAKDAIWPFGTRQKLYDLMSPVRDGVFKMMFQTEENKIFSSYLFSKLLNVDFEILREKMELYKNCFSRKKLIQKERVGDFIAKVENVFVSFEMNNSNTLERNVEYMNSLYSEFAKKDESDNFSWVIQININNFSFEGLDETIVKSTFNDGRRKRTKYIILDVYLPNLVRKYKKYGKKGLNSAEKVTLAMFISKSQDIIDLSKGDETLNMFFRKLKKLREYDPLFRAYDHQEALLEASRMQGEEEGMEKGMEKGKSSIAQEMLRDGFSEVIVQKYTKLTSEEIKNIMMGLKA